jgi:ABC-type lipoprotein export system ATPase subunit
MLQSFDLPSLTATQNITRSSGRVAIARALIAKPEVVFADEPTGALDTRTGRDILTLLREAVDDLGQTVVIVTHDSAQPRARDSVRPFACSLRGRAK